MFNPTAPRPVWIVPAALVVLGAVPFAAGLVRLGDLAAGVPTEATRRFFEAPAPVLIHIVGASLYAVLGGLQLFDGFRRHHPVWHRRSGWVALPAGMAVALSGLWMTIFYPRVPLDSDALDGLRLVFGLGMAVSIVLGVTAIFRRDFAAHRAWMIRGWAIGMGAGTQALTQLPWILLVGLPGEEARAVLMGAAWALNLAVAEWVIRRPARRRAAGRPVLAAA